MALMATLGLDKSKYEQGLQDAESDVQKSGSRIGNALKTMSKIGVAAIGASATAVGVLTKQSVEAYANFQQLEGGVQKLFGDSADAVMKYAQNAYATAGMSANQYMEQATSFSAALINSLDGDTAKAAEMTDVAMRAISDNFNTFGGDISSVQNAFQGFAKQNFSMLDNLKLGYGGTKTEMERLISDANEYAESIGQAGDLSIDSFADIVQAIELVQEKQGIAGTTAKEAATTIEGSFLMTKAAWENLVTGLANGNADVSELMQQFIGSVKTTAGNVMPVVQQALSGIGQAVTELAPEIINAIPKLVEEVVPSLMSSAVSLVTVLGQSLLTASSSLFNIGIDLIKQVSDGLVQGVPNMLKNVLPVITNLTGTLRSNAGTLIDTGIELITNLAQGLIDGIPTLAENIPEIIANIVGIITDNAPKLISAGVELIANLVSGIWENREAIIDGFADLFGTVADSITSYDWAGLGRTVITHIGNGIKAVGASIISLVRNTAQNAWNSFKNISWVQAGISAVTSIANGIRNLISTIPNTLRSIGTTAFSSFRSISWVSLGSNIISGIVSGLRASASAVTNFLVSLAKGALNTVKKFLGIGSPSKVFRDEVGKWIPEGIALGISLNEESVKKAMKSVSDLTMDSYNPDLMATPSTGSNIYGGNNITVQVYGTENPEEFADRFVRRLKLDMRTA